MVTSLGQKMAGRSLRWRILAATTTAILLFAAFPPLEWTALAFIAWIPLGFARVGADARLQNRLGGAMMGLLFAFLALSVNPPEVVSGLQWVGLALGIGFSVGLFATVLSLPLCNERLISFLGPWARVWLPAIVWTGLDYLRLVTTAGHQWGMLGTTQIDVPPLRALLPIAGMWPVTLLTVATGQAIAVVCLVTARRFEYSRSLGLAVGVIAIGWLTGLGLATWNHSVPTHHIRVAAVQSGDHVPTHPGTKPFSTTRRYPELTDAITTIHTPFTLAAGRQGAHLVVWPEASGWVAPDDSASAPQLHRLQQLAQEADTTIVWPYFIRIDPNRTRNELVLITPLGTTSAPTTKDHPVYVIGERSVTSGLNEIHVVQNVSVGLAAGPDGTYTDTLARLARLGASIVAVPTHDWESFTAQHITHLRHRAAEHRIAVVKADWRYGSVIIEPSGEILVATPTRERGPDLLVADVHVGSPGTLYTITGDWLGAFALATLLLVTLVSIGLRVGAASINAELPASPTPQP